MSISNTTKRTQLCFCTGATTANVALSPRRIRNGLLNSPCARDRIVFSLDPALCAHDAPRSTSLSYNFQFPRADYRRALESTTRGALRTVSPSDFPECISLMYSGLSARLGTSLRALGARLRSAGIVSRMQWGRAEVNFVYNPDERGGGSTGG